MRSIVLCLMTALLWMGASGLALAQGDFEPFVVRNFRVEGNETILDGTIYNFDKKPTVLISAEGVWFEGVSSRYVSGVEPTIVTGFGLPEKIVVSMPLSGSATSERSVTHLHFDSARTSYSHRFRPSKLRTLEAARFARSEHNISMFVGSDDCASPDITTSTRVNRNLGNGRWARCTSERTQSVAASISIPRSRRRSRQYGYERS